MATKKNALVYKDITLDDIMDYCKENNQVEWLQTFAATEVSVKRYPRKTVVNSNGKKVSVADKTQKAKVVKEAPSFIQIKKAFAKKFMPEIIPSAKPKAPTMYDKIAAL